LLEPLPEHAESALSSPITKPTPSPERLVMRDS
jgi:hypothetical protein